MHSMHCVVDYSDLYDTITNIVYVVVKILHFQEADIDNIADVGTYINDYMMYNRYELHSYSM